MTSRNSSVVEIKVSLGKSNVSYTKREVFSVSAAKIVCLQHDTSSEDFDSVWSKHGKIIP